jgi:hypothetical protein
MGSGGCTTEFFCKTCGKRKGDAECWLLGFEGSAKPAMKYTINLRVKWDEQRAREPNAVHFCSAECQNKYVAASYGDDTWPI